MEKQIRVFLTGGFFFTCILGTIMHFVYEWSGKNPAVGLIAPVNESTWEHLKLLFFPAVIWTLGGCLRMRDHAAQIICACTAGIVAGMLTIVVFFYTYTGILGTNWFPLDLTAFVLGVLAVYWLAGKRYSAYNKEKRKVHGGIAAAVLAGIALCFFAFTFFPPTIGLFRMRQFGP